MRVIAKRSLRQFWDVYPDAQAPLEAWHGEALKAKWTTPQAVKAHFGTASILKSGRVVFNIGGNKYRLVVDIDYLRMVCFVKFIGTHGEYDRIDAGTI